MKSSVRGTGSQRSPAEPLVLAPIRLWGYRMLEMDVADPGAGFSRLAWSRNAGLYEAIRTMPFNVELAAGVLSEARFRAPRKIHPCRSHAKCFQWLSDGQEQLSWYFSRCP